MATAGTTEGSFLDLFLAAGDMPKTMRQIQDTRTQGPDLNDSYFPKHRGLFAGFTVWLGSTDEPLWRVVDIRWSFPWEADAARYQDDAALLNAEGASELMGVPVVGEQCRVFGFPKGMRNPFQDAIDPEQRLPTITAFHYLFRVANVVVKLFAAEGPECRAGRGLSPLVLKPLADRAAARITGRLR